MVYSRINSKAIFFLGLTHQTAPTHFQHPYEKRPKISKKMLSEHCSMQSSTGREWIAAPGRGQRLSMAALRSAVAALVGASGVKMMRWSALLNGGVTVGWPLHEEECS